MILLEYVGDNQGQCVVQLDTARKKIQHGPHTCVRHIGRFFQPQKMK